MGVGAWLGLNWGVSVMSVYSKGATQGSVLSTRKAENHSGGVHKVSDQMSFSNTGSVHGDGTKRPLIFGGKKKAGSEAKRRVR